MNDQVNEWLSKAQDDLQDAVEVRYPADLPLTPTKAQIQQFYRQAQAVYAFVQTKIISRNT